MSIFDNTNKDDEYLKQLEYEMCEFIDRYMEINELFEAGKYCIEQINTLNM